ncbi:hypothetical protein [Moorena sp. SIO3H5]|uniref:hypothetical protein n=1 Tax=Moorena sp. SIO3H5 TaxID=2607834 RepID=UPI0025F9DCD0|nr:hypothetical protein [Moorena sp. SIO3H5]
MTGKLSAVSGQRSVVSGQWSAVSHQPSAVSRQPSAISHQLWHRLRRWDLTQIKPMLTCCLDAVAHGGNHASCSWGEPPRPHWLPKTALHRLFKSISSTH